MILNRAKDYNENNKELLRQREREQKINRENYLKRKKKLKREYGKKRYYNMSEENKKLKGYQKIIMRLKIVFRKCRYASTGVLQRYFLFFLLLIFKR